MQWNIEVVGIGLGGLIPPMAAKRRATKEVNTRERNV